MSDSLNAVGSEATQEQAEPVGVQVEVEERWPLLYALFFSWIMPAATARRLGRVGLIKAFVFHVGSCLFFFFAFTFLVSVFILERSPLKMWGEVFEEFVERPGQAFLVLGCIVAFVQGCAIGLMLLLAPWGARQERLRSSYYHAMRCVWLQTMHVVVATLALVALMMTYEKLVRDPWWSAGYRVGRWSETPWYISRSDELTGYVCVVLYGWALWGMLRAVGARPVEAPVNPSPTCQSCGYNLVATATEGACPECGEAVCESVGVGARTGIEWECRGDSNTRDSWWNTTWRAIRHPRQFGRDLQVYSPPAAHRRFMLINMAVGVPVGVLVAWFWLAGFMMGKVGLNNVLADVFWDMGPVGGISAGLSVLILSVLFAGLLGTLLSWFWGCNMLPASMRCAAYLSGYIVIWAAGNIAMSFVTGAGQSGVISWHPITHFLQVSEEVFTLLVWLGFSLACLCVYLWLLLLMLRGARYANK